MNDYTTDAWHRERTLKLVARIKEALKSRKLSIDELNDLRRHLRSKNGREAVPLVMALNDTQFKSLYSDQDSQLKLPPEKQMQLLRRAGKLDAISKRHALAVFSFVAGHKDPALFQRVCSISVAFATSREESSGPAWVRHELRQRLMEAIDRVQDPGSSKILAQALKDLPPWTLVQALSRSKTRHARSSRKVVLVMLSVTKGDIGEGDLATLAKRFDGDPDFGSLFTKTHHAAMSRMSVASKLGLEELIAMRLRDIRKHMPIKDAA